MPVNTARTCPTVSIFDGPAADDAFRHKAIADAIADLILGEPGGRGIALKGQWGSGKSTIVGLASKRLEEKGVKVFPFDAWSHQGDPLRRTFLEQLIDAGVGWGWLKDKNKWSNQKELLAGRKETTSTSTTPRVTRWGVFGAFSLLVAPAAIALFNKVHYEWHPRLSAIAFLLSCAPLLVGLLILARWLFTDRSHSLPTLIFSSTETEVHSISTKNPEPTSLEFERTYRSLLTDLLGGTERQLVFVIDNLDRMSKDDARAIWSTMRTFFDGSLRHGTDWHSRVWTLVPFDPEAIQDLFHGATTDENGTSCQTFYSDRAEHFLEKTFQVSFNVPPIILSNWEGYLISLLEQAFPDHSSGDFHRIFTVYDRIKGQLEPPTPRQLKVFVNSIGSLHRIWQDAIPLPQQAAYVLLSGRRDLVFSLRSNDNNALMRRNLSATVGDSWQRNFAALHFNVDPSAAFEALLGDPTQSALRQADVAGIRLLSKSPGFREVVERTLESFTDGDIADPTLISHSALALISLDESYSTFAAAWRSLRLTAQLIARWPALDDKIANGILAIHNSDVQASYVSAIVNSLLESLELPLDQPPRNGEQWLKGIFALLGDDSARACLREKGFRVPGTPEQYISLMVTASALAPSKEVSNDLKPAADEAQIAEAFISKIQQGQWDGSLRAALLLFVATTQAEIDGLVSAMAARVRIVQQGRYPDVDSILLSLFDLSLNKQSSRQALLDLANDEMLYQRYDYIFTDTARDAAAVATVALLSGNVDITQRVNGNNAWQFNLRNAGHTRLTDFANNPESDPALLVEVERIAFLWQAPTAWLQIAEQHPNRKQLIGRILSDAVEQDPAVLPADLLLSDLDKWKGLLQETGLTILLDSHASNGSLANVLQSQPIRRGQEGLYKAALGPHATPEFVGYLQKELQGYTRDEWLAALNAKTELLAIAFELSSGGFTLGVDFQDAALAFIDARAKSGVKIEDPEHDFILLLSEDAQLVFCNSLANRFKANEGNLPRILPPSLLKSLSARVLSDGVEDYTEPIKEIVNGGSVEAVLWLRNTLAEWKVTNRTARAVRDDLKSRVSKKLEDECDPSRREALDSLLAILSNLEHG